MGLEQLSSEIMLVAKLALWDATETYIEGKASFWTYAKKKIKGRVRNFRKAELKQLKLLKLSELSESEIKVSKANEHKAETDFSILYSMAGSNFVDGISFLIARIEGYSIADIILATGKSKRTIYKQLWQAKLALKHSEAFREWAKSISSSQDF